MATAPQEHLAQRTGSRAIEYRLLPDETTISFATRHLLGLGAVNGDLRVKEGRMRVDAESLDLVLLEAEVDMTTFNSGSRSRDKAVKSSKFLDVGTHPTAHYRAESADRLPSGWRLHGTLTVKGIAAPVELMIAQLDPALAVEARATASVDRFAFGIRFPAALASRTLEVSISARAERTRA